MRRGPEEPTWPPWWDQIWHRIGNWVIAIMCVIAFLSRITRTRHSRASETQDEDKRDMGRRHAILAQSRMGIVDSTRREWSCSNAANEVKTTTKADAAGLESTGTEA